MKLRVLDVYAGLGGLSRGFRERGHEVITLDLDAAFGCDITMDARDFAKDPQRFLDEAALRLGYIKEGEHWRPTVVVGGPPCEGFSVLTIGRNWTRHHVAKTDQARLGVILVKAFLAVVAALDPEWWWMENPRGKLRKLPVAKGIRRITITYCQYGTKWQKPTDLWGRWPPSWRARPMCKPRAPCHESAPRGNRNGIQGGRGTASVAPRKASLTGPAAVRAEAPVSLSLSPSRKPAKIPARRPPPSMRGRRHDMAIQDMAGTASAKRAEAPIELSRSFAKACEEPAPPANRLEAWGMTHG